MSNHTGKKLESTKAVSLQRWLMLKTEFMASKHMEVQSFLEEKGIVVNDRAYRMANGWKRDKVKMLERAAKKAEQYIGLKAAELFREKIERRSNAWRVLQNAVLRRLGTKNEEGQYVPREDIKPMDLMLLAQAYDIATKGERLEDGQPTIVQKVDQVNVHTFRFDEMQDHEFADFEREMIAILPDDYEPDGQSELPREDTGGGGGEKVSPPLLPRPEPQT
jgi:hypothetical protein